MVLIDLKTRQNMIDKNKERMDNAEAYRKLHRKKGNRVDIDLDMKSHLIRTNNAKLRNGKAYREIKTGQIVDGEVVRNSAIDVNESANYMSLGTDGDLKENLKIYIKNGTLLDKIIADPRLDDAMKESLVNSFDSYVDPKFNSLKGKSLSSDRIVRLLVQTAQELFAKTANLDIERGIKQLTAINQRAIQKQEQFMNDGSVREMRSLLIEDNMKKFGEDGLTEKTVDTMGETDIFERIRFIAYIDRCYNNFVIVGDNNILVSIKKQNLPIVDPDENTGRDAVHYDQMQDLFKKNVSEVNLRKFYKNYYNQTLNYFGIEPEAIKATYRYRFRNNIPVKKANEVNAGPEAEPEEIIPEPIIPAPVPAPAGPRRIMPDDIDPVTNLKVRQYDYVPGPARPEGPKPEAVEPIRPNVTDYRSLPVPVSIYDTPIPAKKSVYTLEKGLREALINVYGPNVVRGDNPLNDLEKRFMHACRIEKMSIPMISTLININSLGGVHTIIYGGDDAKIKARLDKLLNNGKLVDAILMARANIRDEVFYNITKQIWDEAWKRYAKEMDEYDNYMRLPEEEQFVGKPDSKETAQGRYRAELGRDLESDIINTAPKLKVGEDKNTGQQYTRDDLEYKDYLRARGERDKFLRNKDRARLKEVASYGNEDAVKGFKDSLGYNIDEYEYEGDGIRGRKRREIAHSKTMPRLNPDHYKLLFQGKYYIDLKKLDINILEIRYTKNKHLASIRPIGITNDFKKIVIDLMNDDEVSAKAIQDLSPKETHLLKTISYFFGVNVDDVTQKSNEIGEKWAIIQGELRAGNDNVALKKQARDMLLYFVEINKINRHDYARQIQALGL